MKDCTPITECIACGSSKLAPVLDLCMQPLANAYKKTQGEVQQEFPLAINRCKECYHVQLTHQVNPELMFKDYAYVSGTSKTQLDYFDWLRAYIIKEYGKTPSDVLDIGCNDGSFLNAWNGLGVRTFGVDPAENLHKISSVSHEVHCGFFSGKEFGSRKFDVITCLNAFAHNSNQLSLLENIRDRLEENGIVVCTTSQADMIMNGEFDTIYHEHVSFYNTKSAKALFDRAGLDLIKAETHPIHGTSFIFIGRPKTSHGRTSLNVEEMIEIEQGLGLYDPTTYAEFAEKALAIAHNFAGYIRHNRAMGKTIVGYGAAAKGNTLINFANEMPDFIIDDNPLKQGLFSPGLGCPIYGPEHLEQFKDKQQLIVIPLAWNFYDEVIKKWKELRPKHQDRFVRYFPVFGTEP